MSSLKYLNSGTFFVSAAAFAVAKDSATATFPPRLEKLSEQSMFLSNLSNSSCLSADNPIILGITFFFAKSIPFDRLPLGQAIASCVPVDAPAGAAALPKPPLVVTSASTVGFPLESMILRISTSLIITSLLGQQCLLELHLDRIPFVRLLQDQ